jgi:hypothetical protein
MTQVDDNTVIQRFVQGEMALLANANLRVEPAFNTVQLLAKRGGPIATAKLVGQIRSVLLRYSSTYGEAVNRALVDNGYIPVGITAQGLTQYEHRSIPTGYAANHTPARYLWKLWRARHGKMHLPNQLSLMVMTANGWEPVQEIEFGQDSRFFVRVPSDEIMLDSNDLIVWLSPIENKESTAQNFQPDPS